MHSFRRRPLGFDLLSNDEQEQAVRFGLADKFETGRVINRQPPEDRADYMDELGIQRPRGMLNRAERTAKAVRGFAIDAKSDLADLLNMRARAKESAAYHKKALDAFDGGPAGLELAQAQARLAKDVKTAGERVGLLRGALTPGIQAGDPTDEATEAAARIEQQRDRLGALAQKRERLAEVYGRAKTKLSEIEEIVQSRLRPPEWIPNPKTSGKR